MDKIAEIAEEQVHILKHSLGLAYGEEMYRNHFCTNEGTVDWPHCLALVDMGLMERRKGGILTGGGDVFYVTERGKDVAVEHTPKLTRGQLRYREWLDVSDVTGETFGDFLKRRDSD